MHRLYFPSSYGAGYSHAYGSDGYHHYMRNFDPSYDGFFTEGPSVEDKWRTTYPYVPTSYMASSDGKDEMWRGGGGWTATEVDRLYLKTRRVKQKSISVHLDDYIQIQAEIKKDPESKSKHVSNVRHFQGPP